MAPRPRVIESYGDNVDIEQLNAIDFARLRVGLQTLDDAILDLGSLKKNNRQFLHCIFSFYTVSNRYSNEYFSIT